MPAIRLKTLINAPIDVCFDLSRNIDLHIRSMQKSKESAIAGRITGSIALNEQVTWKARHFGLNFEMTNKITAMERPGFFIDEMIKGPFKKLHHVHKFQSVGIQTEMIDVFEFKAPFAIFGWIAEKIFLDRYMKKLLVERNKVLKFEAENHLNKKP